jgi:hypothetical protein
MIELLLDHGVRVNASTTEGITALHLAVLLGNRRVVQLLIRHGANPNMQTQLGAGPVHMVVISPFVLFSFEDGDLYQTIDEDYHDKLKGQTTTFGNALLNVIREALSDVGSIQYEWEAYYKFGPFFDHVKEHQTSGDLILKDLVDGGAYINLRCVDLSTPLHLMLAAAVDVPHLVEAAVDNFREMTQGFIEYKADPLARDAVGIVVAGILESLQAEMDSEGSETPATSQTDLIGRNETPTSVSKTIESIAEDRQNAHAEDPPGYHSDLDDAEPIFSTSPTNSPAGIVLQRSPTTSRKPAKKVAFVESADSETSSRRSHQGESTSTTRETLLINRLDEEDTPPVNFPALTQTGVGSNLLTLHQQNLKPADFDDLYDVSD